VRVVQLRRRSMALRCDDDAEWDEGRSLFLTFNNSKYTGGTMLIAPQADAADGLIEFVRWAQSEGWACFAHCRVFTTVLISNIRWLRAARCATWSSKRPRPLTS